MTNNNDIHKAEFTAVTAEQPFSAESLAEEIFPLLSGFFVAEMNLRGSEIGVSFPNGQRFKLTVCEEERKKL